MNERRKHIDLFSGIGGFAVAAGWAGYSTGVFCESDPYCCKVLKRHWPDVPIIPDIRDFDGSKWRGADLLTGGFPCQPFSQAGEQRGEEDDRHLWPEMFRVIKEARPDFVLAENVAGLINMALDDVLSQLEGEGYSTGAVVLPACAVNAPHRRDRVWIMARCDNTIHQPKREGVTQKPKQSTGNQGRLESIRQGDDVAHASEQRLQGYGGVEGESEERRQESGGHSGESCRSGRGTFRESWLTEPNVGRVANGIPSRIHRLKALGNAIVPQVAYEILKRI